MYKLFLLTKYNIKRKNGEFYISETILTDAYNFGINLRFYSYLLFIWMRRENEKTENREKKEEEKFFFFSSIVWLRRNIR